MSAPLKPLSTSREVASALDWLRAQVASTAHLHADSRTLAAGDVFLAYPIEGADNRRFIHDAIARGAAALLYQPETENGELDAALAAVPVLRAPGLDGLAGEIASGWYGRPSESMLMIGVTGTNGKTSCTQWIAAALSAALSQPCAVIGTLGSGLLGDVTPTGFTTPDAPQLQRSLAALAAAGAKAVAMEVSSHALHQGRVNGTAFDIAVFTNLSQDHLDYHRTFEAYEAAKTQLFDWPKLRAAVINRDDQAGQRLIARVQERVRTIEYSIEPHAARSSTNALLLGAQIRATASGTAFRVLSDWGNADVEVATLGLFNVSNLLGVLGALLAADVPFADALIALSTLAPVTGRMQQLGANMQHDEPLVVVDYAHTPDALEKTLDALRPIANVRGGRLICVFGCGGDRDKAKRPLMGAIAERLADQVIVTSDNPRSEAPAAIIEQIVSGMRDAAKACCIEDRATAIAQVVRDAAREDMIVLAGKGHEATQEIRGKKRAFSDQDHARLALAARAAHALGGSQ